MKNFLFLLIAAFTMTACVGPMGPEGPQGENGIADWDVISLEIPAVGWEVVTSGSDFEYYIATFDDIPEIDQFTFDEGLVKCYRELDYDNDGDYEVQQEMPISRHMKQELDGGLAYWTETLDYDYGVGFLNVYFTISDFVPFTDNSNAILGPEKMRFRLVIMR